VTEVQTEELTLEQKIDLLLASRLHCAECIGQHTLASRRGVPETELPPVNVAVMVVNGMSVCPQHVQFNSPLIIGA
jgi:hypothetical protein